MNPKNILTIFTHELLCMKIMESLQHSIFSLQDLYNSSHGERLYCGCNNNKSNIIIKLRGSVISYLKVACIPDSWVNGLIHLLPVLLATAGWSSKYDMYLTLFISFSLE